MLVPKGLQCLFVCVCLILDTFYVFWHWVRSNHGQKQNKKKARDSETPANTNTMDELFGGLAVSRRMAPSIYNDNISKFVETVLFQEQSLV